MTKARSYVKSAMSRGSLACSFLAHAWLNLLCRWGWHDDQPSEWNELLVVGPDQSAIKVGDRVVFTCTRCGNAINCQGFDTPADRATWDAYPDRRRVNKRDWVK